MAFTQRKHDKYSLQTKDQKPADKEIIEGHVKIHANPRQIRGAHDSITISIGWKNWCQLSPHMHFIVTMSLYINIRRHVFPVRD